MTQPVAVAVFVRSASGRVLVSRRLETVQRYPGLWQSPGGWIDEGEVPAQAARRELVEEASVVVPVTALAHLQDAPVDGVVTAFFEVVVADDAEVGNPEPHKHDDWLWLMMADLLGMDSAGILHPSLTAYAESVFRRGVEHLDEDAREHWEERAAVRRFDGGAAPDVADRLAYFRDVKRGL